MQLFLTSAYHSTCLCLEVIRFPNFKLYHSPISTSQWSPGPYWSVIKTLCQKMLLHIVYVLLANCDKLKYCLNQDFAYRLQLVLLVFICSHFKLYHRVVYICSMYAYITKLSLLVSGQWSLVKTISRLDLSPTGEPFLIYNGFVSNKNPQQDVSV